MSRYITMPGQAVSYKVGQIKILQLRERARKALGPRFDLKTFHSVVLRAAGPLSIVEEEVDKEGLITHIVFLHFIKAFLSTSAGDYSRDETSLQYIHLHSENTVHPTLVPEIKTTREQIVLPTKIPAAPSL